MKTHGIADSWQGNQYLKTGLGKKGQGEREPSDTFQARKVIAKESGLKEGTVRKAVEFGRGLFVCTS